MRIIGETASFNTYGDRVLLVDELTRGLRSGKVSQIHHNHNLFVNVGLNAITALIAGGAGNPLVDGQGYVAENFTDLVVDCMRVTAYPGPAQPSPSDRALQGSVYIQSWLSNLPSDDAQCMDDSGLTGWNGTFPVFRDATRWSSLSGLRIGGVNDNVMDYARIDAVSSGYTLTITCKREAGLSKIVWKGALSGNSNTGTYTRTGGSSLVPASYTVTQHKTRTWRGYDLTVEYPAAGQVRFSGFIPTNEDTGTTYYEQALLTRDQKLVARSILGRQPNGSITMPGTLIVDEDSVTIDDGVNAETFEFDLDGSVTSGNIAVPIQTNDNPATMANLVNAINESGLLVRASRATVSPPVARVVHNLTGTAGNVSMTSSTASIVVAGLANGYMGVPKTNAAPVQFTHLLKFIP